MTKNGQSHRSNRDKSVSSQISEPSNKNLLSLQTAKAKVKQVSAHKSNQSNSVHSNAPSKKALNRAASVQIFQTQATAHKEA